MVRTTSPLFLVHLLTRLLWTIPDDVVKWEKLLLFGKEVLLAPLRAGRKFNLSKLIKDRAEGRVQVQPTVREDNRAKDLPHGKPRSNDEYLATLVSSKIEEGNLSAAVRILCSDDKPATVNDVTFRHFCEKHPAGLPCRSQLVRSMPFSLPNWRL